VQFIHPKAMSVREEQKRYVSTLRIQLSAPTSGRSSKDICTQETNRDTSSDSGKPVLLSLTNFIPDRSRPGLTTTAIGAVDLQGAGGNWATVGRRSRGGRRVHRQREKRKGKSVGLRIGTLNVGTMTGKGRELADMMERRKVDILCVQETRWKGSKARSIGAGFKLFYYGMDSKRNGVGVVLKEEFVRNVLEVKRVSDRVMSLKLEIEGVMLNVVSGYAPQVGCELEEKERFWSELDEVMESIPMGERVVIGTDFNVHLGEGNTGDEEVMGKFGVKERNLEGQMVVDFAKRMDMGVVNTYFQKREEHRVTYKSGGRRTQVDYILCRRGNLKEISDCKVVVGESVARQHRMVVCRMTLMVCKMKRSKIEKKTKWWKLKKEECCEEFRQKLRQALGGQVVLPDDWETTAEVIRETGRKVLGVSSGRRKEDKETWWWNEEVQDSIQRKRLAKKKWDMDRTEENRQEYKELQRRVKREVSKAKQKVYDELYTRLDTREGEDLYRLARQRDRDGKDVQQVRVIKDRDGRVLTSEESVQRRWKEYFEELMNEENEREKRVEGVNSVEQKVDKIRKDEVRKALKRVKSGKAVGPDDIPVEVWKCLGEAAVEFLASLFNRVLESERMPEEWRRSVLVPIFKNKGDVQSCSNYRGIKLMSHTMKLWERVVEARLRKVVEICEQQYGFMPRKSTTDAIFALRILMEKYRDGQRELHCVFVDLEKAYDRVPREELWYCMRKSGVAEKYVRVVQDMYERSRTVVRCAVGQTEEFKVEVGLHQGSALSPFLFAIVMDQLSEEVRQESPWTMMFADDIVICSESREQVEENLERWRFALERRGMKVSRSKTEYMCVNEREGSGTVRLQGEEEKKVQEFKYLNSTVQSNGECGKEVKKQVQAGWNGWRKVSGVLFDQKISARIKGKVYRTVVRAAMLYGLETVSLRKRQESELEVAELKMLRFSLGVTRLDRIRNEYIRGTAHVGRLGDKVREARLRWFGHVQRRESQRKRSGKSSFVEGEAKLIIKSCFPEDGGAYTCVAENTAGKTSSSSAVHVREGKALNDRKIFKAFQLCYLFMLYCTHTHTHTHTSLNHSPDHLIISASSLRLSDLPVKRRSSSGTVLHLAGVCPLVSAVVPLQIESSSLQVEVRAGETARLSCTFRGNTPIVSCWVYNKKEFGMIFCNENFLMSGKILESSRFRIESSSEGSSLVISETRPEDSGRYTLVVRDRVDSAQHSVTLSVIERPQPPASSPVVCVLSSYSLVLSWSGPCYDGGSAITGYVVEVQQVDSTGAGCWTELSAGGNNTSLRVSSGLQPQAEYRFRVRACNAVGLSDPGPESQVIRMEGGTAEPCEEKRNDYVIVTIDEKHKVTDHYNVLDKLGVGKFGHVYRLAHKETGQVFAGKFYKGRREKEREAAKKEIELMNSLHHPKLVQCLAAYDNKPEIVMVMELIAGGELFERIVDDNFEHTEQSSVGYMHQILQGVEYMHQQNIVHLDLKPENIVCENRTGFQIKIIDFGLARKLDSSTPLKVMHGTPEFVAPEVINFEPVCLTTDMWSIGVICYILLSGESPFQGESDSDTLALVTAAQWEFDEESFEEITNQAKDFISSLLQKNARQRMSCDKALSHAWMKTLESTDNSTGAAKNISKDKMKKFLARQKWKQGENKSYSNPKFYIKS
ncbi:hypothetical protein QTP86_022345, partial [Hemibagrus guttatus]